MERPDFNSRRTWDEAEAHKYLNNAFADMAVTRDTQHADEIIVSYDCRNRREVVNTMLEHGWALTSVNTKHGDDADVWFERIAEE